MEHRKNINDRLVEWIRTKVETEYPEDIALVCVYGSWLSGTMNRLSDVDCYFIPKTQRGSDFARTFILEGVGYDIYPMSWERLEDIAQLHAPMQPLLGDVEILYCADPKTLERFHALQARMTENLRDDAWIHAIAEEKCREAAQLLRNLEADCTATQMWKTAAHISTLLAYAVMISCHTYNHFGMKKQYEDLQRLAPWAAEHYRRIPESETAEAAIGEAEAFLKAVSERIGLDVPASEPEVKEPDAVHCNPGILAEIYQEICSTFNKIYVACEAGNAVLAFVSAGVLQYELDDMVSLGCPSLRLLEDFDHRKLEEFSQVVRQAEETLLVLFQSTGTELKKYADFTDFEKAAR